ncbi:MAG TPA: hypothetical protein VMS71_05190, partial [Candidatus Acidoferrum sp.]|nr:hypothetical protein [Candidatus Acidoferrum sp.]
ATPLRVPVTIASPVTLTISPGSFAPHLVYAGVDFPISFTVNSASFSGPADSTALTVQLASAVGQPPLTTIFSGTPAYSSFQGGIINYQNLSARVDTTAGLQPGWYAVKLNYRLFSGSSILTLQNSYPDSLYVLPREAVAYSVSSLTPSTAAAGAEVAFSFNLTLNATSPVEIRPGSALLTVSGSGFSATVNMGTPDSLLHPGSNQLQAEAIFVPASQLGKNLTVSAVLNYRHPGSANYLSFSTSFGGETIPVSALPVVQVIRVDAVAPNQPRVNTGQKFQISCSIANVADARTGAIQLRLTSDGSSTFTPLLTIPSIDPLDTVQAFFDVTASTRENAVEVFRVDIVSEDIHRLPPIDNIALVTIQTPASLALSYTVFGGAGGFIGVGETFSLTVSLTNFGHADVSKGSYVLSTHGMNLGLVDTVGDISVLSPVSFTLLAPSQDTTVELTFSLTSVPLDLNTGQPAQIRDTSFTYTIQVVSANASVLVESQNVLTVPATEGTSLAFFDLTFTNRGASSITAARLDTISLGWGTSSGRGVILDGLVDQTLTGFYENGLLVSTADLRDSVMVLRFSDFGLPPLGTRTVEFRAQLLTQVPAGLGVMLDTGSIIVRYSGGPLSDLRVPVKTSSSAATVFHTFYVTTSADFAQSFMVENNPYRPLRGPARFNYVLSEASSVEFQIFTLTGELVYTKNLLEGTDGTQPGEHILEWDGRNDRGDIILNGVYVVSITLGKTGLNARLKLAVLK